MKARVIVAMPAQGSIKSKTSLCLAEMCLKFSHRIKEVWTLDGTYLHRMREKQMKAAVDTDATHLMLVDSDVIFPPDGMERLLRQQKPVIGATYKLKNQQNVLEGKPVGTHKPLGTEYGTGREVVLGRRSKTTHEVQAVATGFMLVDLDVVRGIPQPWFDFSANDDSFMGEDVWFCERVREHGHQVWLDPTIPIGHIGDWVY